MEDLNNWLKYYMQHSLQTRRATIHRKDESAMCKDSITNSKVPVGDMGDKLDAAAPV